MTKEQKRLWQHVPLGLLNVILIWVNPVLGGVFGLGFLGYEFIQEWRKQDWSYKDVIGWLWGVGIAGSVWAVAEVTIKVLEAL